MLIINSDIDLHYSPDDAARCGRGYYLQRYDEHKSSQLFKTQFDAKKALDGGKVRWS